MGRPVHLFLQYWAVDAFRADRILADHGLAPEAGSAGAKAVARLSAAGQAHWRETLGLAKEIGEVDIDGVAKTNGSPSDAPETTTCVAPNGVSTSRDSNGIGHSSIDRAYAPR